MKTTSRRAASATLIAALPILAITSMSQAYLGGFENKDGYQPFLNMVQNYNAGQYGISSGYMAMAPVAITPSTGLWHNLAGGFSSPSGISYATGHQFFDRTYVNSNGSLGQQSDQGLVFTTGHEGVNGPALKYKYDVDASDLGGLNPLATGGTNVGLSFWARGQLDPGLVGNGYFGNEITFEDSTGNVGFNLGVTKTSAGDKISYWNGSSLFVSSINASSNYYDRWDLSFDLAAQTVTASYYQFVTNTSFALITNAPLSAAMSDFSHITFRSTPGVNNAKLFSVDDFTFRAVPTPGAAALLAFSGIAAGLRRRR